MDAVVFLAFAAGFLEAAWKSFERILDAVDAIRGKRKFSRHDAMKLSLLVMSVLLIVKAKLGMLDIVASPVFGKGMVDFGVIDPILTGMLVAQGAVAVMRLFEVLKGAAIARSQVAQATAQMSPSEN